MPIRKIDDSTIEVDVITTTTTQHSIQDLLNERTRIETQRLSDAKQRDAELLAVNELLAAATDLGVSVLTKP